MTRPAQRHLSKIRRPAGITVVSTCSTNGWNIASALRQWMPPPVVYCWTAMRRHSSKRFHSFLSFLFGPQTTFLFVFFIWLFFTDHSVSRELQECSNLDDHQWTRSIRPFRLELAESVSRQQFNGNKLRLASLEVNKLKRFNNTIKTPWPINIIHAHYFFFVLLLLRFWKAATAICDFWTLQWDYNRI